MWRGGCINCSSTYFSNGNVLKRGYWSRERSHWISEYSRRRLEIRRLIANGNAVRDPFRESLLGNWRSLRSVRNRHEQSGRFSNGLVLPKEKANALLTSWVCNMSSLFRCDLGKKTGRWVDWLMWKSEDTVSRNLGCQCNMTVSLKNTVKGMEGMPSDPLSTQLFEQKCHFHR